MKQEKKHILLIDAFGGKDGVAKLNLVLLSDNPVIATDFTGFVSLNDLGI